MTINSDDPAYCSLGDIDATCQACDDATYDGFISSNYLWTVRSPLDPLSTSPDLP